MLDSYTSSMCNDSWGRSSFAQCLIEVNSEANLVDVHDHCPKKDGESSILFLLQMLFLLCLRRSNVGSKWWVKRERKGKFKSTNSGKFASPSIKETVRFEPKVTPRAPKKGATNVSNPSKSSSMWKTADTSPKKLKDDMRKAYEECNDISQKNVL
ncbi:hypothetical protein Tco_0231748 [Tanacetum coccineum]